MTTSTGCGSSAGQLLGVDELLDRVHLAARVDVGDALAQRLHLGLAERGAQRLHLAVDVGLGHMVQVDQRQRRDAAARQRLGRPGADAAQADDGDARGAHARVAGVAVQAAQAAEAAFEVGVAAGSARLPAHRSHASRCALDAPDLEAQAPPPRRR